MEEWEAKSVFNLFDLVSKDAREERLETCRGCEHHTMVQVCSQCGCFLPIKTWLKSADCPKGRWVKGS